MSYLSLVGCILCCLISGCSGKRTLFGSLNTYYDAPPEELSWKKETELRTPRNSVEESVVEVAASHKDQTNGALSTVYITHKGEDTYVATVESLSRNPSRFDPKNVVRYVVRTGRIRAIMGPCLEPFPDSAFERSLLFATQKAIAEGGWSVIPISDRIKPVSLKGIVHGKCTVEVAIYEVDNGPGDLICTKLINPCPPD